MGSDSGPSEQPGRAPPRSPYLTVGGGLTSAAGVVSIVNGLSGLITGSSVSFISEIELARTTLCGVMVIVFGIVALIGGVFALKRRRISSALAGAVLGMMGGGLVGFYLGLAALVVFALSHENL